MYVIHTHTCIHFFLSLDCTEMNACFGGATVIKAIIVDTVHADSIQKKDMLNSCFLLNRDIPDPGESIPIFLFQNDCLEMLTSAYWSSESRFSPLPSYRSLSLFHFSIFPYA